ncbi:MAG: hypothetical protein FJ320_01885 [SAR202 cluster bacterium]|nr:hypothetical protein [SAR202 cluster bacterium]
MPAAKMVLSIDKHDAKFWLAAPYKGDQHIVVSNGRGQAGTRVYAAGPAKDEADLLVDNYYLPITLMAFEGFVSYAEALRAIGYDLGK